VRIERGVRREGGRLEKMGVRIEGVPVGEGRGGR